jgi:hypothetical protein
MKKLIKLVFQKWLIGLFCLPVILGLIPLHPGYGAQNITLPEGNDFATSVLLDPWDMNQFSDISQYLNSAGQAISLQNIQVANGVFSAKSVTADPNFYVLFPGYKTAMLVGKVGHNYPIQSSVYKCLYIAKSSSGPSDDAMEVLWFQDEDLNIGKYGVKQIFRTNTKPNTWSLVKTDLSSGAAVGSWNASATWQGLRIDPSVKTQTDFSMDWVRLTDCNPVVFTVPGLSQGTAATVYLTKNGHEILIGAVNTGNETIDLQGVEAGDYTYTAKDAANTVLSTGSLTINKAPIATFTKPSMTSGKDYAEANGISWNMAHPSAVQSVECLTTSFLNGIFTFTTPYPVCPDGAPDRKDPKIFLNSPKPASTNEYRYFSMKFNGEGPWQNVPDQMIVRLIWSVSGTAPGTICWLVSQDIPTDVVWRTYSVDLFDAFNGLIEERSTLCPANTTTWQNTGTGISFRLDPNENQLAQPLTQAIEWLHLSAMDTVIHGTSYPVSLNLNKRKDTIGSFLFYYTTTLASPTQNRASGAFASPPGPPVVYGPNSLFLPVITSPGVKQAAADVIFDWDTTNVTPGEYYLCVVMDDTLNSNTNCSEAPVAVQ